MPIVRGSREMQKRRLGRSELEVSALGLGCMGYGNARSLLPEHKRDLISLSNAVSHFSTPLNLTGLSRMRRW